MVAVAIIGSAAIGAGVQAYSANQASKSQQSAARQASQTQLQMYDTTRGDLSPYNTAGQTALGQAQRMGPFNFNMTQGQLQETPGYQFNLAQGEKAVQNSAAARGLGVSGAALKGGAAYASGLADTTYQNQFSNALTQYQTNYGNLMGRAQLGENAAAQTGAFGTQTAAGIASNQLGAGNAAAAGSIGIGNALTGGLNSIPSYYMFNQLFGPGGAYGGGGAGAASSGYYGPAGAPTFAQSGWTGQ